MEGKKGLSTVVTTLIIVLLVLAAIGIIWNPIKDLLTSSEDSFSQTKCYNVDIQAVKVINTTVDGTTYNVTLKRSATGDGEFGAKLVLYDAEGNTGGLKDAGVYLGPLEQAVVVNLDGGITGASKIEVNPYFIDETSGEEVLCSTSSQKEFQL